MTEHLYYSDSYLKEFEANVTAIDEYQGAPAVILDRTAFYPTSGGQPHDTGMLGAARVTDVVESPSGDILHVVDSPLPAIGPVRGSIDWARRFDHMQQHTGQHVLSQAFVRAAEAGTLSFHLGAGSSTIDVAMDPPVPELIHVAEELATQTVFDDRPVNVLTVDRAELKSLGIRKESQREGEIRVIDIAEFDRSACGGTHVGHTGEIGIISIVGWERYKGGTRIEFVCGMRAFSAFRKDHEILRQTSRLFSAHPYEVPRLTEKLIADNAALVRDNARLSDESLQLEALNLLNGADKFRGVALIVRAYSSRTLEALKVLALKVTSQAQAIAVLGVRGTNAQVVVARSAGVRGSAGSVVKEITAQAGGKGGGRPELAQAGGIEDGALADWMQKAAESFRRSIAEAPE